MLLAGRNAVVYGGAGAVGGAVARAFARAGAAVHLAGRTPGTLDAVASDIRAAGGTATTTALDALDELAVDRFTERVADDAGSLDISVNLIGVGDVQGTRWPKCRRPISNSQ